MTLVWMTLVWMTLVWMTLSAVYITGWSGARDGRVLGMVHSDKSINK
jgi:hypothetical protein